MVNPENKGHEHHEIIVNARPTIWKEEYISYEEIVEIAFPSTRADNKMFTVKYSRGPRNRPDGTLVEGQRVKVINGMVVDVGHTDKS